MDDLTARPRAAARLRQLRSMGPALGFLLAPPLGLVAVVVGFQVVAALSEAWAARGWRALPATLEEVRVARVDERSTPTAPMYEVRARYAFVADGVRREGTRFGLDVGPTHRAADLEARVARVRAAVPAVAYVSPGPLGTSVLDPRLPCDTLTHEGLALATGGLTVLLLLQGLLWWRTGVSGPRVGLDTPAGPAGVAACLGGTSLLLVDNWTRSAADGLWPCAAALAVGLAVPLFVAWRAGRQVSSPAAAPPAPGGPGPWPGPR